MIETSDCLCDFPYLNPDFNPLNPPILRLTCIGVKERTYPQYHIDNSTRDWHTWRFQYTISGEGKVDINGQTYLLKENDAFFSIFQVTANTIHRLTAKNHGVLFM